MLLDHVQSPWDCRLQSFVGAMPFGDPRAPGDPPSADARGLLAHDVWPEECLLQTFVGHTPRAPEGPSSSVARVLLAHEVRPGECLLQTFVGNTPSIHDVQTGAPVPEQIIGAGLPPAGSSALSLIIGRAPVQRAVLRRNAARRANSGAPWFYPCGRGTAKYARRKPSAGDTRLTCTLYSADPSARATLSHAVLVGTPLAIDGVALANYMHVPASVALEA